MLAVEREKLAQLYKRYQTLEKKLLTEEIMRDLDRYTTYRKELKKITPLVQYYQQWLEKQKEITQWKSLLSDQTNWQEEDHTLFQTLEKELITLEEKILALQLKNSQTKLVGNTIVEIRGAVGGKEANFFARDLAQMYLNFVKQKQWKFEILEQNKTTDGGYNFISFIIQNKEAFAFLQWEGGVHRVQRIPKTEASGRIHTSTATVAILVEKSADELPIAAKDLRFDTYRSSGAGGQHVNTTDSAVRVTHLPTGLMVACQAGRSQHDNKDKALKLLRARLFQLKQAQKQSQDVHLRNKQIGEGERSEKIRTYNFPQNRVTDHRIKFTIKNIDHLLAGNLEPLFKKLTVLKLK